MVGRHLGARFHKRRSTNDTVLTNGRAIDNHRAHADQRVTPYHTAVQNRSVADMSVLFHHRILAGKSVHHAVILDIRPIFNHDTPKISAQAGIGANINTFAENDIANQHCGWVNIAFRRNYRDHPVNLVNRHGFSCYASANPPKR